MRRTTIGMLALGALAVSACGSSSSTPGASTPRPPAPVNLTVYIGNSRVSVSPSTVGAGPVAFIITNQASQAEALSVLSSHSSGGQPLADTGPINPQATAQVTVNFTSPGAYSLSTAGGDAVAGSGPQAAVIHIGPPRTSSASAVLQP